MKPRSNNDIVKTSLGNLKESSNDVLKPKTNKQITKDITQEVMIELLNNESVSFFKSNFGNNFSVYRSSFNISKWFDEIKKIYGDGLYVVGEFILDLTLKNVYPIKKIKTKTYKIEVSRDQLELVMDELVLNTLKGNLGIGFHVKYFEQKVNESLFVPRQMDDIMNDLVNKIYDSYSNTSVCFSIGYTRTGEPGISKHNGINSFNNIYEEYGNGIYLYVPDDEIKSVQNLISDITINTTQISDKFLMIPEINDVKKEKDLIRLLCERVFNRDDKKFYFIIKKYSDVNESVSNIQQSKMIIESITNLFKPKEKYEISKISANKILESYDNYFVHFYLGQIPKIMSYRNSIYMENISSHGRGIYIKINTPYNSNVFLLDIFYELNVGFSFIYGSDNVFRILSHDKIKLLLTKIIEKMLKIEKNIHETFFIITKIN